MSFINLKVNENVFIDNSIVNYEYHTHQPYTATTYNLNDEIRIPIQTQDLYTLPSESYIYIEGQVVKKSDGKGGDTLVSLNNGIAFLFEEIRYELGGTVIDQIRNPGITSTLKSYVSYTKDQYRKLQNAGFCFDERPKILNKTGHFSVCVPLKCLLGFAEDFQKIIMNVRQELVLIRSNTDVHSFVNTSSVGKDEPKVIIEKIAWRMPHVNVSDVEKLRLLKYLETNKDLTIAFRTWELQYLPTVPENTQNTWTVKSSSYIEKPRMIIFALQTNRKNTLNRDTSLFDSCSLRNVKVYLNAETYPYDNLNIDWEKNHWSVLYEMYAQFQKSYYYKSDGDPLLSPSDFKHSAPIVVIDCSHQNENLKSGNIDLRIEFETSNPIPEKTAAFCIILHDRTVKYNPLSGSVKIY